MLALSDTLRTAQAIETVLAIDAQTANGRLLLYAGTRPQRGDTAPATPVCTLVFKRPSFAIAKGVMTLLTSPSIVDSNANGGTPTWARITDGGGNFIYDMDVGAGKEITLDNSIIVAGATVNLAGGTFTIGNAGDVVPPPSCAGVAINPTMTADQIQALITANPPDMSFCFAPGTYVLNHYLSLKQGQKCISTTRRAAILTGNDLYKGAIACDFGTTGHEIRGFVVERFTSDGTFPIAGLQVRDQGIIDDCEVRTCQNGIHVSAGNTITGNYVHHNRQYGIEGGPGNNILIEGNEVYFNNTSHMDPSIDAGGSKIVGSTAGADGVVWRNNYVHDNYGVGIWSDGNVINALYEDNYVADNGFAGIDHEISWAAIIRRNFLKNNNYLPNAPASIWDGGEIELNNSQNVEIYANRIETTGTNAISMVNSTRSEPAQFPQFLANVNTHDNDIYMRGTMFNGFAGDSVPAGIVWTNNHYHTDLAARWQDMAGIRSFAQWQADGFDVTGTNVPWT